jgi:cardiolipin synthase
MMHAKTVVVDSAWSIVGSANMDERSMELNEENVLGVADRDFALAIERGVTEDFACSREILLEEWRQRSIFRRGLEWACKVLIEQY